MLRSLLIIFLLANAHFGVAADPWLAKADSLYSAKQYTQAFEHYSAIFKGGQYSPAMLLKMAFIEEGLGHLGNSMYFLNLYFLTTADTQALKKMEELAERNNLKGYENDEAAKVLAWLHEHYQKLAVAIAAKSTFLFALMFFQFIRKRTPTLTGLAFVFSLFLLFVHINFSEKSERGIVTHPDTYLMSGPSAGASVVAIIGEGHQLEIGGQEDVWLRVLWNDQEVFVKENFIQPVRL